MVSNSRASIVITGWACVGMAAFKPIGTSNRFGSSQFTDPNAPAYNLSPEMLAQQNKLMGIGESALDQYGNVQRDTRGMFDASQRMYSLGNQYLSDSPQEQAKRYYTDQQELMAGGRESDMARLKSQQFAEGRTGLAANTGVGGMGAANPEMQALWNARLQQDRTLAAGADQFGRDRATWGANLVSGGGQMLRGMYGVQGEAYNPYSIAMGGVSKLENLGMGAYNQSLDLAGRYTDAGSNQARLLMGGMPGAIQSQQQANSYSPWGTALSAAGAAGSQYAGMFKGSSGSSGGYGTTAWDERQRLGNYSGGTNYGEFG